MSRLESTEEEVAAFVADFEAGEGLAAQPPCARRLARRRAGRRSGGALLFPIRSLGPDRARASRTRRTPVAACGSSGPTARRSGRRHLGRRRAHRLARGSHRRRRRPDPAHPHRDDQDFQPVPGREDWTVERHRRLLEAVHPRRLSGRAVPGRGGAAAVPVPPVDLRRARRRPPDLRPGGPLAAAAAARRSTTTATSSPPATSPIRSAPASGTGTDERTDEGVRPAARRAPGPLGRPPARAAPGSPAPRWTRCSPTTGRSCSASSPSTASSCCCSPASTSRSSSTPAPTRSSTGAATGRCGASR